MLLALSAVLHIGRTCLQTVCSCVCRQHHMQLLQQLTRQTSLCCLTICHTPSCTCQPGTALLKPAMFLCRGQIHLTWIEAMGLATAFKHTVNGRSYLEVHHRVVGSKVPHVLSLKANHPDDAASWLRDMQLGQKVVCGAQCAKCRAE